MIYGNGKFVEDNLELLDCTIGRGVWRNFEGDDGDYSFTVFLPRDLYESMEEEGWYVKHKEKYAGDEREFQVDVGFRFDKYPPKISMVTHDGASVIVTESNVASLQTADFEKVDLILRPYNWTKGNDKGCAAKLDSMTVWLKKPRRSLNASFRNRYEEEEEE